MTHPTSTDICRAQGWTVGDILEGQDKVSTDRIRITAIGEAHILARWQSADLSESAERLIGLDFREWHKVGEV